MSRSEEGKSYRARKREQMGEEAYLAMEAEKRQERRLRSRIKKPETKKKTNNFCLENIIKSKPSVKATTIKASIKKIENLHQKMFKKPFKSYAWTKQTNKVLQFIIKEFENKNTAISYLSSLASILMVFEGYEKAYKFYSEKSIEMRQEHNKITDENKLTDREKEHYLNWEDVMEIHKAELNSKEKALISIYTLQPPRRLDYRLMRISEKNDLDTQFNYYNTESKEFIFNNYKTNKKFKQQIFKISNKLAEILDKHIKEAKLQDGDFLFGKTPTTEYKSFSNQITKIFKQHLGKNISVNLLRHSYISNFLKQPDLTVAARKEVGNKMAHSIETQLKYQRFN